MRVPRVVSQFRWAVTQYAIALADAPTFTQETRPRPPLIFPFLYASVCVCLSSCRCPTRRDRLITASWDGKINRWDLESGTLLNTRRVSQPRGEPVDDLAGPIASRQDLSQRRQPFDIDALTADFDLVAWMQSR